MPCAVIVEKVSNGYILTTNNLAASRTVVTNMVDLFDELLLILEGKSKNFYGEAYARVSISWGSKGWPPVPGDMDDYKNKGKDADERYREERKKILEPSTIEMEENRHKEVGVRGKPPIERNDLATWK